MTSFAVICLTALAVGALVSSDPIPLKEEEYEILSYLTEKDLEGARDNTLTEAIKKFCEKIQDFESSPITDFLNSKCKTFLESSRGYEESENERGFDEARDNIFMEGVKKICEKIQGAESNAVTDFLKSKCKQFLESAREYELVEAREDELVEARDNIISQGVKKVCERIEAAGSNDVIDYLKSLCKQLLESSRSDEELASESEDETEFDEARDNIFIEGVKKICEKIQGADSNAVTDFLKSKCKQFLESAREDELVEVREDELVEARDNIITQGIKKVCGRIEAAESNDVIDYLKSLCKELLESSRTDEKFILNRASEEDFDARKKALREKIKKICQRILSSKSHPEMALAKSKCKPFLESAREDDAQEKALREHIKKICQRVLVSSKSGPEMDLAKSKCKRFLESAREEED